MMTRRKVLTEEFSEELRVGEIDSRLKDIAEIAAKYGCDFEFGKETNIYKRNLDGSLEFIGERKYVKVVCSKSLESFQYR